MTAETSGILKSVSSDLVDKTAITPCSTLIGRQKFYLGYKSIGLQQDVEFAMVGSGVRGSR